MASFQCYKCKTINYFNPDPELQLLVERKTPDKTKTFQALESGDMKRRTPKQYTLTCSQCGTVNTFVY